MKIPPRNLMATTSACVLGVLLASCASTSQNPPPRAQSGKSDHSRPPHGAWERPHGGPHPRGVPPPKMVGAHPWIAPPFAGWGGWHGHGGPKSEIARLERESLELAWKVRISKSDKEKAESRKQLEATLGKIFDAKQAAKAEEIADLEKRVKEMRAEADARKRKKADTVKARIEELTRPRVRWGW